MSFTELFIRKPVLSAVLSLLLLMIGLVSYSKLTVRQYPKIDSSVVNISTGYPGASAKTMESYVTSPIESSLSGINGIDYIKSNSTMGSSNITIHFRLGVDIDQAVSDVRDKVSSARYQLPKQANDPIIVKNDPNADPIMYISYTSNNLSPEQITDYLKRVVQPTLQTVDGVGQAQILGERGYTMRILLDPQKMAQHNVSTDEIVNALTSNQIHPPSGQLKASFEEYDVTAQTDVDTTEAFNHLVINSQDGHLTRLGDVATAKLAPDNVRSSFYIDERPGVVIGIVPRSDGNPLTISKDVQATLERLKQQMPGDLNATVVWDNTKFIDSSIHEVKHTIIEATVCVILVMFLFLGSVRMLSIPIVTIPLSLIGICSIMLALGFSINTMTLLAMVLAIGLVVDDSIVVAENIHRHIEEGMKPIEAAIIGSKEIQFAIISMTLTLAAVFTPIGFLSGLTGSLFKEFAFALAGTVIISGFIALVLSPMMCSKVITAQALHGKFAQAINTVFNRLANSYEAILRKLANIRISIPFLLMACIFFDVYLYNKLPNELAPQEDAGAVLTIANAPPNANLEYTEQNTQQMGKVLNTVPEKVSLGIINGTSGVNSAMSFLTLKPWNERDRSTQEIANELNGKLWGIPGIQAFAINPFFLPGASSLSRVGFVLQSTKSYEELYSAVDTVKQQMLTSGIFANINTNLKIDTPEITLDINRDLAGDLGIPISAIANTINVGLGKPQVTEFSMGGQRYNVIPGLLDQFKERPLDLYQLTVRSKFGQLVPLSNLVSISEQTRAKELHHFDQLRSATINADLAPGKSLGEAVSFLQSAASKLNNGNLQYNFTGESRQFLNSGDAMFMTFVYAILFIVLLLSAQFESFIAPFIVLCGLFFSIAGALIALNLMGYSSNIYTQIGLMTLIGLISKHGILIVEFANKLLSEGRSSVDAIVTAAKIRLRPILMTTAAMVLGAIPLMLASGAGALSRKQMGLVIVSGMSFGTLMTLIVVPCIFLIVEDLKRALRRNVSSKTIATVKDA